MKNKPKHPGVDKTILDWFYTIYIPSLDPEQWYEIGKPNKDEIELDLEEVVEFIKRVGRYPADKDEVYDFVNEEQLYELLLEEDEEQDLL